MAVSSALRARDRKSTRLNSCHTVISYAVFCLKKKTSARAWLDGEAEGYANAVAFLRQLERSPRELPYTDSATGRRIRLCFCFLNDTATTEIYTLSLHDALPIRVCPRRVPPMNSSTSTMASSSNARRTQIGRATSELQSHSDLVCRLLLEKK